MSLKDTITDKLEKQLDVWEKKLDGLKADFEEYKAKAKNDHATENLKNKTRERIGALQEDIEAARDRLKELRESGESRFKELRGQVEDWLNRKS